MITSMNITWNTQDYFDLTTSERVKLDILEGADVNASDDNGYTPLHFAARCTQSKILRLLLDSGAKVSPRTHSVGYTPLHFAAEVGNVKAIKMLLDAGARVDEKDKYGWTPLHEATQKMHVDAIRLLKQAGSDPWSPTPMGQNPMDLAGYHRDKANLVLSILEDVTKDKPYG